MQDVYVQSAGFRTGFNDCKVSMRVAVGCVPAGRFGNGSDVVLKVLGARPENGVHVVVCYGERVEDEEPSSFRFVGDFVEALGFVTRCADLSADGRHVVH